MEDAIRLAIAVPTVGHDKWLGVVSKILPDQQPGFDLIDFIAVLENYDSDEDPIKLGSVIFSNYNHVPVHVISYSCALGSAGAYSALLSHCEYHEVDWVLCLDDDSSLPDHSFVSEALTALERMDRDVAVLSCSSTSGVLYSGWALYDKVRVHRRLSSSDIPPSNTLVEIDMAPWSGMFVRVSVLGSVRPRDDFFFSHEDYDFCLRIRKKNLRVVGNPCLRTSHDKGDADLSAWRVYYDTRRLSE